MGYPYHELIPPAILLEHPGLTEGEFKQHLAKTHYSAGKLQEEDPWDTYTTDFNTSPEGMASILSLDESPAYKEFKAEKVDENGFSLRPPFLTHLRPPRESELQLIRHVGNIVHAPDIAYVTMPADWKPKKGQKLEYQGPSFEDKVYLIDKVIGKDRWVGGIEYEVVAREVERVLEIETFQTEQELFAKWPIYKPENMFDFSQQSGAFKVADAHQNFMWQIKDGKFYLDPETFNRIPSGLVDSEGVEYGYIDLILTAEAIRFGAWKLFARRGGDYTDQFLEDFSEAKANYNKAVRDSHYSLRAEHKGMTLSDMFRLRSFRLPDDPQGNS
jgi:hypothetical protein